MNELVTVVIPTHNRAHLLLRAVESVLRQDYSNLEIVIVGDASVDDTQKIAETLQDSRIKYMRCLSNVGVSAARNRGVEESEGSFIAFLDDDDTWLPRKVSKQLEYMVNPEVGLVYCSAFLVDEAGEVCARWLAQRRGRSYAHLLFKNFICSPSTVMVRRKYLAETGLFDPSLHGTADFDMWIRLSRVSLLDYVPEYLACYTAFQRNSMGSTSRMIKEYPALYEKFLTYPYPSALLRRRVLAYRHYEQGNAYAFLNDVANARQSYSLSIQMWPFNVKAWVGITAVMAGRNAWNSLEVIKRFLNRSTR